MSAYITVASYYDKYICDWICKNHSKLHKIIVLWVLEELKVLNNHYYRCLNACDPYFLLLNLSTF